MNRETAPRFAGIGGHPSAKPGTVEWLTPPWLLKLLTDTMGRAYRMDPCACIAQPWGTAERMLTRVDNGLIAQWAGAVFLNPPYTTHQIDKWLDRLAVHGDGMAVIFARTETDAFFEHVWNRAAAVRFLRGRINFHFGERWQDPKTGKWYEIGDESPHNAGGPTVLCAYGQDQMDVLAAAEIGGQFIPLHFPRSVLGIEFANEAAKSYASWREALAEFFADRPGPVCLADLYAAFATHPKSATNPNYQAKLRQQLQRGPYDRVGEGLWSGRQGAIS